MYAVKLLPKALIASLDTADAFAQHITRIQALKAPFLARVHDAPVVGDNLVIVSEFLEGTDLARSVPKSGPLPVAKALDYVRQVAAALQFLHQADLAHRNIKPSNLLLCQPPNGEPESVKLLDLAQATFAGQGDIRADLFALGGTAFFLLTGRMPTANTLLTKLRPDVPSPVLAVIGRLLAKSPESRFQSPAELLTALQPTAGSPRSTAVPLTRQTQSGQSITPLPATSARTIDSAAGQTLLGDWIGQAPTPSNYVPEKTMLGNLIGQTPAPPKAATDKTILGNLIAQTPADPASEETLLGEFIAQPPAAGQQDGPAPVWLGSAKPLPAAGSGGGIVKKAVMLMSAIGGACMAAAIILGVASFLGQFQLKRKTSESAPELAESTRPTDSKQPSPDIVPKIEPKIAPQPEPKPEPEPKPKPEADPDDVPSLIMRLKDKDDAKRLKAAEQLEKIGPAATEAIPALTAALKDKHVGVRLIAATTLGRFGPNAKEAVGALVDTVKEDEPTVRGAALAALGNIGPAARAACPVLVEIVKDPRHANRTEAAQALAHIGGGVETAPLWLGLLNGKDKPLAKIALSALEATGKLKYPQLTALVEALKNDSSEVRAYAAKAIGEVGPDAR